VEGGREVHETFKGEGYRLLKFENLWSVLTASFFNFRRNMLNLLFFTLSIFTIVTTVSTSNVFQNVEIQTTGQNKHRVEETQLPVETMRCKEFCNLRTAPILNVLHTCTASITKSQLN
jgi:hypothetical protein